MGLEGAANSRAALRSGSCSARLGFGRIHSLCSLGNCYHPLFLPNMKQASECSLSDKKREGAVLKLFCLCGSIKFKITEMVSCIIMAVILKHESTGANDGLKSLNESVVNCC